jgi:hypothetical protein
MNILFKAFLTLHITGGTIGLFTGTINLVRKKGDKKLLAARTPATHDRWLHRSNYCFFSC